MTKTNETTNLGVAETNPMKGVVTDEAFAEFSRVLVPVICEKDPSKLTSIGKQAASMFVDGMDGVDGRKDGQIEGKTLARLLTELGKIDSDMQAGIDRTEILHKLPERMSVSDLNGIFAQAVDADPDGFLKSLRQLQATLDCKNGPADPLVTPVILDSSSGSLGK